MKANIRLITLALVLTGVSTFSSAQVVLSDTMAEAMMDQVRLSSAKTLRVREAGALYVFTEAMSGKKGWFPATCQPTRGERVKLKNFTANSGGVRGVNSAHVEVVEGRCKGRDGWIGTTYLGAEQIEAKSAKGFANE